MAVVFELVVNFGENKAAADLAIQAVEQQGSVMLRDLSIPLRDVYLSNPTDGSLQKYIEFSVVPSGLQYGGEISDRFDVYELGDEDFSCVANQLYDLLKQFDGFEAARVGWDTEGDVDLHELEMEWLLDEEIYRLDGLVLSARLVDLWRLDERFVPFREGFSWLPYCGSKGYFQ